MLGRERVISRKWLRMAAAATVGSPASMPSTIRLCCSMISVIGVVGEHPPQPIRGQPGPNQGRGSFGQFGGELTTALTVQVR